MSSVGPIMDNQENTESPKKKIRNSGIIYEKQKRVFKIIVVGDSNVGKTCLTYRFCEGKFLDKSEATIGVDFRERSLDVNGEDIKVGPSVKMQIFPQLFAT